MTSFRGGGEPCLALEARSKDVILSERLRQELRFDHMAGKARPHAQPRTGGLPAIAWDRLSSSSSFFEEEAQV